MWNEQIVRGKIDKSESKTCEKKKKKIVKKKKLHCKIIYNVKKIKQICMPLLLLFNSLNK